MSRYIDADLLQEDFKEAHNGKRSLMIDVQPTADVRENVRAKMDIIEVGIQGKDKIYTCACSNCGHVCDMQDNFCRHCGADMRGEKNDRD